MSDWGGYQEDVAAFFRSLGLSAQTNQTVAGVRTHHDVDVVVRSQHVGFDVLWLVECKAWKRPIPKEKVLALRSIVDDIGADRGFVMAERGYQRGALEAARFANVMLTSLADLKETLVYEVGMAGLASLPSRLDLCRERYWSIGKDDRIELGLRADVMMHGFSGDTLVKAVEHTLRRALLHGFPLTYHRDWAALAFHGSVDPPPAVVGNLRAIASPTELFTVLDAELRELEERLDAAEAYLREM
jgi:hypothetical protein